MDIANSVDIASSFSLDAGAIVNTLIGAFFGALFAFAFAAWVEKRREFKSRISAANRALFVLVRQANAIANIKKQAIDPYRNDPARLYTMIALQEHPESNMKIDVESLEFLFETKHRELLLELLAAEERFDIVIQSLNARSKLHCNEVQPLVEKAGFSHSQKITLEQLKDAIGPRLFATLDTTTGELIESVDDALVYIANFAGKFFIALKELYPNAKFVQLEEKLDRKN